MALYEWNIFIRYYKLDWTFRPSHEPGKDCIWPRFSSALDFLGIPVMVVGEGGDLWVDSKFLKNLIIAYD